MTNPKQVTSDRLQDQLLTQNSQGTAQAKIHKNINWVFGHRKLTQQINKSIWIHESLNSTFSWGHAALLPHPRSRARVQLLIHIIHPFTLGFKCCPTKQRWGRRCWNKEAWFYTKPSEKEGQERLITTCRRKQGELFTSVLSGCKIQPKEWNRAENLALFRVFLQQVEAAIWLDC